jgi:hypothetical protein
MAPPPLFFDIVVERLVCRAQFLVSRATTTCVVRLPKLFNASRTGLKYPMEHTDHRSNHSCTHHHPQHRTLPVHCFILLCNSVQHRMEHTDPRSHHSCTHHHSQHRTLQGQCLYSPVTVSAIIWNILITALTTAALTTVLNTGLYQLSVYTRL